MLVRAEPTRPCSAFGFAFDPGIRFLVRSDSDNVLVDNGTLNLIVCWVIIYVEGLIDRLDRIMHRALIRCGTDLLQFLLYDLMVFKNFHLFALLVSKNFWF